MREKRRRERVGESEHKILLTASRPNLIPRAELGGERRAAEGLPGVFVEEGGRVSRRCWSRRDKSSCRWLTTARIRVYICTYSAPGWLALFHPSSPLLALLYLLLLPLFPSRNLPIRPPPVCAGSPLRSAKRPSHKFTAARYKFNSRWTPAANWLPEHYCETNDDHDEDDDEALGTSTRTLAICVARLSDGTRTRCYWSCRDEREWQRFTASGCGIDAFLIWNATTGCYGVFEAAAREVKYSVPAGWLDTRAGSLFYL